VKRTGILICLAALVWAARPADAINVSPTGVNVNAQGATSVFLTFGRLQNQRPAEASWCGALVPATPDIGLKCDPSTLYGLLPSRYNLSTLSGTLALTDIMSIPPSVARLAYQAARNGAESRFFYVRRFVSLAGGPDEYVVVTCRLSGGGARVPLALTDVKLGFESEDPVSFIKPGHRPPALSASISYNGTGRLKGRWEVVTPGEELPSASDLLTEATLPVEERALQRRYTQLKRFNEFLPPTGRYTLAGPDVARLPNTVEGMYLVLLRIEASDDKEGDSNLAAVGAGSGTVHSSAVAGFPLPVLRYFVGSGTGNAKTKQPQVALLHPRAEAVLSSRSSVDFSWSEPETAVFYRLEIQDGTGGAVLSAILPRGMPSYRAPSWLAQKAEDGFVRWRVVALDSTGNPLDESEWRTLQLRKSD
jgi:hypothetical protein